MSAPAASRAPASRTSFRSMPHQLPGPADWTRKLAISPKPNMAMNATAANQARRRRGLTTIWARRVLQRYRGSHQDVRTLPQDERLERTLRLTDAITSQQRRTAL